MGSTKLCKDGVSRSRVTDRMWTFATEYVVDLNGEEAAIRAGYSKKTARVIACNLLKHPLVSKIVGKLLRENNEQRELRREDVLRELMYMAFRDPIDFCDKNGMIRIDDLRLLPERVRRCIDGIKVRQKTDRNGDVTQTVELKLCPKTPAIDLCMKHLGMFPDKVAETLQRLALDYDQMYNKPDGQRVIEGTSEPVDPIEQRLAQEESGG